jgi:sterol desaturase/sphingolipid hydroxylase (fatty acid hydroxylase superfamily)
MVPLLYSMINQSIILFCSHLIPFWVTVAYTSTKETLKPSVSFHKTLPIILFNQFVTTICFISPFLNNYPLKWTSMISNYSSYILMGMITLFLQMFVLNIYFAITHYACHKIKYLFKYIHYLHHGLVITHGAGSIYCHPFEHMFVNLGSVLLPILLFKTDVFWSSILIAYVSYETVIGHTSYVNKIKSRHHLHHKYFNVNFDNTPYLIDKWIFNTYRNE